ncbi:MAG: hypothetical protein B6241_06880 [Spirochaetaceae bacterium 4572_59]|nr:MAG: hypothetical protein B6241_06880 [Spirochaetaceae bacterium 4572_59]
MKKGFVYLFIIIFLPLCLSAKKSPSQMSIDIALNSEKYLQQFTTISEGSGNEELVLAYLKEKLSGMNVSYRSASLNKLDRNHSFSSNLIIDIPGKQDVNLIIVVPINREEESSLAVSVVLGFIQEWSLHSPPVSLTLLFAAADMRKEYPLGSLSFLDDFSYKNTSLVLYYNPTALSPAIEIKGSVPGYNAPGWMMNKILAAAESANISTNIDIPTILINKTGINRDFHPILSYLSEGIPAIAVISEEKTVEYQDISQVIKNHLTMINTFVDSLSSEIPKKWEQNYIYVKSFSGDYIYISEKNLIMVFLLFFAFSILIPLFQERRIYLNFRKFRHQLWTIPLLMFLTFQFFMLSTLIIEEILVFRNLSELVAQYPLIFFLIKMTIILFLSRLMLNILRGLPFPKTPHFYSYLAFVFSLFAVLFSTIINICYSLFFLWILICTILFVVSRGKGKKQFFLILSLVPIFVLMFFIFQRSYIHLYNFLLLSRVWGNLVLSILSLPFTLMITSLSYYHHHYERSRHEIRAAIGSFSWGVITLFLLYRIMNLPAYTEEFPQRVTMLDVQDMDLGNREITISSNGEIGDGQLILYSSILNLDDVGKDLKIQGEIEKNLFMVSNESDIFLDRRSIILEISALIPPEEVKIEIHSDKAIEFYDCEYPYEILPDERSARIYIGINPPNPLRIPMVFSKDSRPDFYLTLKYSESPYLLELKKELLQLQSSMVLKQSLSFDSLMKNQ